MCMYATITGHLVLPPPAASHQPPDAFDLGLHRLRRRWRVCSPAAYSAVERALYAIPTSFFSVHQGTSPGPGQVDWKLSPGGRYVYMYVCIVAMLMLLMLSDDDVCTYGIEFFAGC